MIRPIAVMGDTVLTQMAREVTEEELPTPAIQAVIDDLIQTLRSTTGVGLAAPQISESLRIVIVDKPLTVLVNPVVTPMGDETDTSWEGCLSVPGVRGEVRRAQTVRVEAVDRNGKKIDALWTRFRAIVVQHEIDHLDGILYVQRTEFTEPDDAARAKAREAPGKLPERTTGNKKTFIIDSEKSVGGKQYFAFQFEGRGRLTGLRIQPGGALVTGAWLSGVRLKKKDYPAGAAEQMIVGMQGLHLAPGDQLRVELKMPKGKRRILAEADFDPA